MAPDPDSDPQHCKNMKKIDFSCILKVTEDFGTNSDPQSVSGSRTYGFTPQSTPLLLIIPVPTKPKIILKTFFLYLGSWWTWGWTTWPRPRGKTISDLCSTWPRPTILASIWDPTERSVAQWHSCPPPPPSLWRCLIFEWGYPLFCENQTFYCKNIFTKDTVSEWYGVNIILSESKVKHKDSGQNLRYKKWKES